MTSDRYDIVRNIESIISTNNEVSRDLFEQLREKSRNTTFLQDFDQDQFNILVSKIFVKLTRLNDQLDVITTIANIIFLNANIRNTTDQKTLDSLLLALPHLYSSLDHVSERRINSESQYKDFLPIFRLYFLMCHNTLLTPHLKDSIIKISGKLLNFVSLSSSESLNLNIIIIEILKTIYTYLHQVEDPTGIESSFVLSCNKFQSLYIKEIPNKEYDEILQHFGNVLITIPFEISQNYMLNKLKFVQNEVTFINKLILSKNISILSNAPLSNLLTLDALMTIDNEDSGVRSYIKDHLDLDGLEKFSHQDPNLSVVISEVKQKLDHVIPHSPTLSTHKITTPTSTYETNPLGSVLGKVSNDFKSNNDAANSTVPRFEDLPEDEQDREIEKMNELFEKIERNGIFKLKMK